MKETVDDLRVPVKKDDDREKNEIVNGKVRHTQAKPILIFFGIYFCCCCSGFTIVIALTLLSRTSLRFVPISTK